MKHEITPDTRAAVARIFSIALFGIMSALPLHTQDFKFIQIDHPNAEATSALGINDQGTIVGAFVESNTSHGFLLRGGKFKTIDPPGAIFTAARSINARNEIVGFYSDANGNEHGFYFYNGRYATIDIPNSIDTRAEGINDMGVISGEYSDVNGNEHGFLFQGGKVKSIDVPDYLSTDIWAVANNRAFAGDDWDGSTVHGFVSPKPNVFVQLDYPRAVVTAARGINDKTEVVGRWDDNSVPLNGACSTQCHGFFWARGEFRSVDAPGAASTVTLGINNLGLIVGRFIDATGHEHGFMAVKCTDSGCQ